MLDRKEKARRKAALRLAGPKRGLSNKQIYFLLGFVGFLIVALILVLSYPKMHISYCFWRWRINSDPQYLQVFKDDKERGIQYLRLRMNRQQEPEARNRKAALAAYARVTERRAALNQAAMMLAGDPSSEVRETACREIGRLADKAGAEPLFRACGDADEGVRAAASGALQDLVRAPGNLSLVTDIVKVALPDAKDKQLATLEDTLVHLAEGDTTQTKEILAAIIKESILGFEYANEAPMASQRVLVRIGQASIPELHAALLGTPGSPYEKRTKAGLALARDTLLKFEGHAINPLVESLKATKDEAGDLAADVREAASDGLLKLQPIHSSVVCGRLVWAVQTFRPEGMEAALSTLKKIGEPALVYVHLGLDTENGNAREALLKLLVESESREVALRLLHGGLTHPSDRIRWWSEKGLKDLKQESFPVLLKCLVADDPHLRHVAVLLFGDLSDLLDEAILARILVRLRDNDERVRDQARKTIKTAGAKVVPLLLREAKDAGTSLERAQEDMALIKEITGVTLPEKFKDYTEDEKRQIYVKLVEDWIKGNPGT